MGPARHFVDAGRREPQSIVHSGRGKSVLDRFSSPSFFRRWQFVPNFKETVLALVSSQNCAYIGREPGAGSAILEWHRFRQQRWAALRGRGVPEWFSRPLPNASSRPRFPQSEGLRNNSAPTTERAFGILHKAVSHRPGEHRSAPLGNTALAAVDGMPQISFDSREYRECGADKAAARQAIYRSVECRQNEVSLLRPS